MTELLSPAGNFERLETALYFGADAVYAGAKRFGLRAFSDNFDFDELTAGAAAAHALGKKLYLTLNVMAHEGDLGAVGETAAEAAACGVDAFLVADPGVFAVVRKAAPGPALHISTQANVMNSAAVRFWADQGAKRIVLAREVSLDEIKRIRDAVPDGPELEAFVHGAMCVAYSGRCLMSAFLTGRSGNAGCCAQPCRWEYELREKGSDGAYMTIEEDGRGTYILNAKDLNMIRYLGELARAGVDSFKIEGRMKSAYYVAAVTRAYRFAIDDMLAGKPFDETLYDESAAAAHRPFSTGFYFGEAEQNAGTSRNVQDYAFVGKVLAFDRRTMTATIGQRNRFAAGDELEVLGREREIRRFLCGEMVGPEGERQIAAPYVNQTVMLRCPFELHPGEFLRKKA
ncbi:MAG: U32 family peptidase [Eubacteriales bacterium]|nr:U32 family peptidase [Eubacteriales bacterium]